MTVIALEIDPSSVSALCGVIPCNGVAGGGALGLSAYLLDRIVTAMEIGIVAVAIIALFTAAIQQVVLSTEESTVKDARTSYIYIIAGLAVTGLARWLVLAISPTEVGSQLVNVAALNDGIGNIVTYFRLIIVITLMANTVIQAFRLIASQGEQEQVDKAKKRLIAGFIGAGVIMLANVIAEATIPGLAGTTRVAVEIAGIASYIIMVVGFMALLTIVLAGVLLIISVDEGLKDKAKTAVKTSIVALIVVFLSYALVTAFIAL